MVFSTVRIWLNIDPGLNSQKHLKSYTRGWDMGYLVWENGPSYFWSALYLLPLFTLLKHGKIIISIVKCGMKLLIHSQTSSVAPVKFGNGQVIPTHLLLLMGLKFIHVSKRDHMKYQIALSMDHLIHIVFLFWKEKTNICEIYTCCFCLQL